MPDLLKLKKNIQTEALRLGFNHFGVAPATPVAHYEAYLKWVENEHQGGMAYLARPDAVAKRADPRLIEPDVKRVISLALPYRRPVDDPAPQESGFGRISAYALTGDYHDVIWEKLDQLEAFIRRGVNRPTMLRSYVDTGPVLERAFASTAGLGATGKNSCLIVPGTGSYFFLAEVLTSLTLPVDNPFKRDLCGSCTRCIDACPTNCILPGHTIDASRCISYLTIEKRGAIPDELKAPIGDWVFGCDVCQMVCPHNAWTQRQRYPLGKPQQPQWLPLESLFEMNEETFKETFAGSALIRTGRRGLLRNAAIVLGNQRAQSALPALRQAALRETDEAVVKACRWAISAIEDNSKTVPTESKA
ncbi:MAG: tRNA epoxyqueuosine(34) reductase QueG [Chloroflexota bacterium]|nr:tRNA epoxyqueuosine(34) reductase QueG [Chloroflexota bacterium]